MMHDNDNDDDLGLRDTTADMSEEAEHYPEEGKQLGMIWMIMMMIMLMMMT